MESRDLFDTIMSLLPPDERQAALSAAHGASHRLRRITRDGDNEIRHRLDTRLMMQPLAQLMRMTELVPLDNSALFLTLDNGEFIVLEYDPEKEVKEEGWDLRLPTPGTPPFVYVYAVSAKDARAEIRLLYSQRSARLVSLVMHTHPRRMHKRVDVRPDGSWGLRSWGTPLSDHAGDFYNP